LRVERLAGADRQIALDGARLDSLVALDDDPPDDVAALGRGRQDRLKHESSDGRSDQGQAAQTLHLEPSSRTKLAYRLSGDG
jgi:hypothetical protein